MDRKIKKRRDEFIIGMIDEFKSTDNSQTNKECYNYVKKLCELHITDFKNTLNEIEKTFIEDNNYIILSPLRDINTFVMFLNNKSKSFNQ
jgi:hypothetical protein